MSLATAILQEQNHTTTENGMAAFNSSLDACVDFFFQAGGARKWSDQQIITLWEKARVENEQIAYRLLFWSRDVRGGAGERRFFRVILKHIFGSQYRRSFSKLLSYVPEYGRADDLFEFGDEGLNFVVGLLLKGNGLAAKWAPRKGPIAKKLRLLMGMTPKNYRNLIVSLSKTVEQDMCAKRWDKINYEHVPSVASKKYRGAFARNDHQRYSEYIQAVTKGEKKMNASAIFPNDVIKPFLQNVIYNNSHNIGSLEKEALIAQWNSLPNYLKGSEEKILCVCDTSGSMSGTPMEVAVALGLYTSERLTGVFKDTFITFNESPKLLKLKGDIISKMIQMIDSEWGGNTNLEKVFDLILKTAVAHDLKEKDMPTKIVIISDMQFDSCVTGIHESRRIGMYGMEKKHNPNAMQMIKQKYANAGYKFRELHFGMLDLRETLLQLLIKQALH